MTVPTLDQDQDRDRDLDRRVGRLEGIAEQLLPRLDRLEKRLDDGFSELRQAITAANDETNRRIEATNKRIDRLLYWVIGIPLAVGGLLATILFKGG